MQNLGAQNFTFLKYLAFLNFSENDRKSQNSSLNDATSNSVTSIGATSSSATLSSKTFHSGASLIEKESLWPTLVKIYQIRSFSWSECGKIRTRKNSVYGHISHSALNVIAIAMICCFSQLHAEVHCIVPRNLETTISKREKNFTLQWRNSTILLKPDMFYKKYIIDIVHFLLHV